MPYEFLKLVGSVISIISLPISLIFWLARDRYLKMETTVAEHDKRHDNNDVRFETIIKESLEENHKMQLDITRLQSEKISQEQMDKAIQSVERSIKTEVKEIKVAMREAKEDSLRREDRQQEFQKILLDKLDNIERGNK